MARKKIPIKDHVAKHFHLVYNYFERAMKDEKMLYYDDVEIILAGKDAFKEIPVVANKKGAVVQLAEWITQYATSAQWESCRTSIRQKMLLQKKEYRSFRIPIALWRDINLYAEDVGLTKTDAIQKAITIASNMLRANRNK
jgi:hypothetical protein